MANYNIQIAWNGKDSLPDSDPAKVISGNDFQIEFEAIQAAINSKPDALSILNLVYPVGSVYINAGVSTNPATILGIGTWVAFGTGRTLVGIDASDTAFDTLGETGGSKNAALIEHDHTFAGTTASNGNHYHIAPTSGGNAGAYEVPPSNVQDWDYDYVQGAPTSIAGAHNHTFSGDTGETGSGDGTNANLPPYIVVYMWKRTA